jgi:hypothetical protein
VSDFVAAYFQMIEQASLQVDNYAGQPGCLCAREVYQASQAVLWNYL